MTQLLKGNVVAKKLKEDIKKKVEALSKSNKKATLGIVRLGSNPDDIYYENSILKNCKSLDIEAKVFEMDLETSTDQLIEKIEKLNQDEEISGILIFRPLPKHIDEDSIAKTISPEKDVDCMNPSNLCKIFEGDVSGFLPCTPKAAMEILEFNDVDLEGKNVVVINRSMVVGKPLAMMLLEKNATVTICHSRTKDLPSITKKADVVMTALGIAKFLDEKHFNNESIVIDIGMAEDEDGKMSGDVDFEQVKDMVKMITPVPGGVGSMTTTILLNHVVDAASK